MSKHWRPDDSVACERLRPGDELDALAGLASEEFAPLRTRALPPGAKAGLVLVAAACAGLTVVIAEAFIPLPPIADTAPTAAIPYFGYCRTGGGPNCVVDGETFYINGAKVRIGGIDAPDTHPPGCAREAQLGLAATGRLHALLNSGAVTIARTPSDDPGLRFVRVDGADVGAAMVRSGLARSSAGGPTRWC